jgi:hypothetical protein
VGLAGSEVEAARAVDLERHVVRERLRVGGCALRVGEPNA